MHWEKISIFVFFTLILISGNFTTAQTYYDGTYHEDVTEAEFSVRIGTGNFSIVFDTSGKIGSVNTNSVTIHINVTRGTDVIIDQLTMEGESTDKYDFELTGEKQEANFSISSSGEVSLFFTTIAHAEEFIEQEPFSIIPYLMLGAIPLLLVLAVFFMIYRKIT